MRLFDIIQESDESTVDENTHPNSKIYDRCWDGYERVPGKKRGEKGSCRKKTKETTK